MNFVMTFIEGLASFISPCILPLLPVYLVYFAGGERIAKRRTLLGACAFTFGFSLVFIALGVFAGSLGSLLSAHRSLVSIVCGGLIILFGLSYLGLLRLPTFGKTPRKPPAPTIFGAFIFGLIYAVSLTPCVGAFLGAALATAAQEGSALRGAALLAAYALGLAIPFILTALFMTQLKGLFMKIKSHYKVINPICGALLVLFGIGMILKSFATAEVAPPTPTAPAQGTNSVVEVTSAAFSNEVLNASVPVVVDFWAPWCGPCRRMAPILEELAATSNGRFKVAKVNVDDAQDLATRYDISAIPNIVLFEKGMVKARSVGLCSAAELRARLKLP